MAQDFDWTRLFTDLGAWNEKGVIGPDIQAGLGGMAKAVNPQGVTGNVGEMFKNYVQGIAARQAFNKRMQNYDAFLKMLPQLLGQQPSGQAPYAGGSQLIKAPAESGALTSSNDWLKKLTNPTGTWR